MIGRYLGEENIRLKTSQARLRRYGHDLQKEEANKIKQNMEMEVRGTRAKGRPILSWMGSVRIRPGHENKAEFPT